MGAQGDEFLKRMKREQEPAKKIPIRFPRGIKPRESDDWDDDENGSGLKDIPFAETLGERGFVPYGAPAEEVPGRESLVDRGGLPPHLKQSRIAIRKPPQRVERKVRGPVTMEGPEDDVDIRFEDLSMGELIIKKLKTKKKRVIVVLIVLAIILTPLFVIELGVPVETGQKIMLDGNFSDWDNIYRYEDSLNEPSTGGIDGLDIIHASTVDDKGKIFVFVEVDGDIIFEGDVDDSAASGRMSFADSVLVFVDTNPGSNHGYSVFGIEADYMAEVQGFGGEILSAELKKYNERFRTSSFSVRDSHDWNAWEFSGWSTAQSTGGSLELGFDVGPLDPAAKLDYEIVILIRDHLGKYDHFDRILSLERPSLLVERKDNPVELITDNDLLVSGNRLHLFSLRLTSTSGDSVLEEILMTKFGDIDDLNINSLLLYEDTDSDGRQSPADVLILNSFYGFVSGLNDMRLPEGGVTIVEGEPRTLLLLAEIKTAASDVDGSNLGIHLNRDSFRSDAVTTYARDPMVGDRLHYLLTSPVGITIDGLFSDWTGVTEAKIIADAGSGEITDPNVDIRNYGYHVSQTDMAVYVSMHGNILAGDEQPMYTRYFFITGLDEKPLIDIDRDGRYDLNGNGIEEDFNTRDDDYDNDDVPDSIDPDLDNDLVINEMDLAPRNPTVGERYPDLPERPGLDIYRIYTDLDGLPETGYDLDSSAGKTGAELLIEIRGKNSEVFFSEVYLYEPDNPDAEVSGWVAASVLGRTLEVAVELKNLEAALDLTSVLNLMNSGTTDEINFHFVVLKWNGAEADYSNGFDPSTRSNFRVPTLIHGTGNYDSSYSIQFAEVNKRQSISRAYMVLTTIFIAGLVGYLLKNEFKSPWSL